MAVQAFRARPVRREQETPSTDAFRNGPTRLEGAHADQRPTAAKTRFTACAQPAACGCACAAWADELAGASVAVAAGGSVVRKACVWPLIVPRPTIVPASLMPVARGRFVQPELAGIKSIS